MHTLRMTITGLVVLAVFVLAAWLWNRSQGKRIDGAWIFIWVWLAAALINLLVGVFAAGISLATEILVLLVVFGIPAARPGISRAGSEATSFRDAHDKAAALRESSRSSNQERGKSLPAELPAGLCLMPNPAARR